MLFPVLLLATAGVTSGVYISSEEIAELKKRCNDSYIVNEIYKNVSEYYSKHPDATDTPISPKILNLEDVKGVREEGVCRYVLFRAFEKGIRFPAKLLLRGFDGRRTKSAVFYEGIRKRLAAKGLDCQCKGGGRIEKHRADKTIYVNGTSKALGTGDPGIVSGMLKRKYRDYTITAYNHELDYEITSGIFFERDYNKRPREEGDDRDYDYNDPSKNR